MSMKRRLRIEDSMISPDRLKFLERVREGHDKKRAAPRGETGFVETEDGGAVKVTVDTDGFIAENLGEFHRMSRLSPEEYAPIKQRPLDYDDLRLDNIDILSELGKI